MRCSEWLESYNDQGGSMKTVLNLLSLLETSSGYCGHSKIDSWIEVISTYKMQETP